MIRTVAANVGQAQYQVITKLPACRSEGDGLVFQSSKHCIYLLFAACGLELEVLLPLLLRGVSSRPRSGGGEGRSDVAKRESGATSPLLLLRCGGPRRLGGCCCCCCCCCCTPLRLPLEDRAGTVVQPSLPSLSTPAFALLPLASLPAEPAFDLAAVDAAADCDVLASFAAARVDGAASATTAGGSAGANRVAHDFFFTGMLPS